MGIGNYAENDVKEKISENLLEIAKNNKSESKVKKFFTVNNAGPVDFIRQQCGLKTKVSLPKLSNGETVKLEVRKNEAPECNMWGCDGCGKGGASVKGRNRCDELDYDLCDECLAKVGETLPEYDERPHMFILDVAKKNYYKPLNEGD